MIPGSYWTSNGEFEAKKDNMKKYLALVLKINQDSRKYILKKFHVVKTHVQILCPNYMRGNQWKGRGQNP